MKTLTSFVFTAFLTFSVFAQQTINLVKNFGGIHYEYPTGVCADDSGNIYIASAYSRGLTICGDTLPAVIQPATSNQTQNLFISKLDTEGNCIWTKAGVSIVPLVDGGAIGPEITDIEFYNGRIYCAGVFTNTMVFDSDTLFNPSCQAYCTSSFLLVLDTLGSIIWSKCFLGSKSYSGITSLTPHADGFFVSGTFVDSLSVDSVVLSSPGSWLYNGYLMSFDVNGKCRWGQNIGNSKINGVHDHVLDGDRHIYVAGEYLDSIVFPSDTLYNYTAAWQRSMFVAKFNVDGEFIWAKGGGEELRGDLYNPRLDYRNGEVYYSASFKDSIVVNSEKITTPTDIYRDVIVKIGADGEFRWTRAYGNRKMLNNFPSRIVTNNEGFMIASGYIHSLVIGTDTLRATGDLDNLIVQFDEDGEVIYHKSFGGVSQDRPQDIYYANGNTYFVSAATSDLMVDTFPVFVPALSDILLVRIGPNASPTGLYDQERSNGSAILLYPNPTASQVRIKSDYLIEEVIVNNAFGKNIFHSRPLQDSFTFQQDVEGIYFVTVRNKKQATTIKLIVSN